VAFYPAVFEEFSGGRHRLAKGITVASPCWGDIVDAEIVASDARQRVALLQVPWRGHPALRLADDKSITEADHVTVVGMPEVIGVLSGQSRSPVEAAALFQEKSADVDYVAVREGKPLFLLGRGDAGLSAPWTGVPILLPDTQRVAAAVSLLYVNGGGEGGVLNRIQELTNRLGVPEPATAPQTGRGTPEEAREVFLLAVRIADLSGHQQYEEVAAACRKFIERRPRCSYGYVYAAMAAEKLQQANDADRLYQEALTRAPDSVIARVTYADFLNRQDRTAEAMPVLEPLWSRTALRPYLSDAISAVLSKRHEYNRGIRFLEEALAVDPNNARALIRLGDDHNALREYEAAAEAFGKAADLWPEHDTVRAHFACNLELAGREDEAEVQYRKSVAAHPQGEYAHHMFASFLAHHRPECRAEALSEARTALRLPNDSASDRDKIERLIEDLESKGP
jgi:tetratricopeptide (TPR) repeat protein